jgi:hypothetical protein
VPRRSSLKTLLSLTGVNLIPSHCFYTRLISVQGAYYAAQLGISLKAKDSGSRTFLFDLLGVLERMKQEIGPNDALGVEAVSVAYVENFALKVFAAADIEDRRGDANRLHLYGHFTEEDRS